MQGQRKNRLITVAVRDVRVGEATALLDRSKSILERLWTEGSLHALLATPEGRAAAESWEWISSVIDEGLRTAAAEGRETTDLILEFPADYARATLTFIDALMQRGRAAGDLTAKELALSDTYIDQVRRGIAAAGL